MKEIVSICNDVKSFSSDIFFIANYISWEHNCTIKLQLNNVLINLFKRKCYCPTRIEFLNCIPILFYEYDYSRVRFSVDEKGRMCQFCCYDTRRGSNIDPRRLLMDFSFDYIDYELLVPFISKINLQITVCETMR